MTLNVLFYNQHMEGLMTNDEVDAALRRYPIAIPRGALDDLMDAAGKYLDILGRKGVRATVEELIQAMRTHTTACKAIAAAYQRATLEIERGILEVASRPSGVSLH
jgi:hypothetical protein